MMSIHLTLFSMRKVKMTESSNKIKLKKKEEKKRELIEPFGMNIKE